MLQASRSDIKLFISLLTLILFSNQSTVFKYLDGILRGLIGFGPNKCGDAAFILVGSVRRYSGAIDSEG